MLMLSLNKLEKQVHQYLSAMIRSDEKVARQFFSANFGINASQTLSQYLVQQLNEFAEKAPKYLVKNQFDLQIIRYDESMVHYCVLNTSGVLILEHIWALDGKGLFVGDQSQFQVIPKLQFCQKTGRKETINRCIAIKTFDVSIGKVLPLSVDIFDLKLSKSDFDDVYNCRFKMVDDEFNGKILPVNIYPVGNYPPERRQVYLKGKDHPFFQSSMYPDIQHNQLFFDAETKSIVTAVGIVTEDKKYHFYKFPDSPIKLNVPIVAATLMDGNDHDWALQL